ncbi:guanine deaminase [Sporomusa malonica]|uniref:Guanine deaminase n=1 Tax=Sporomusa malonica TaxID=112901 RepID=A0A1W2A6T0_9FIRM|nr:guanine deaminase [Sporomusa malonica]SMC56394.1 guanine deaminase [Sporomusa malonica]
MKKENILILKGTIIFTPDSAGFEVRQDSYLVVHNGIISEIYKQLPAEYAGCRIIDHGNRLIIPGFVDLHTHAAQFNQRGLGLDLELLDWLNEYTFKEEAKFTDTGYAAQVYEAFTEELIRQGTTRAVLFATIHKDSSNLLCDILSRRGLGAYVGKVNMDVNCPDFLREDTQQSLRDTEEFFERWSSTSLVNPIITPRFAPTSTGELLAGLGKLAVKYNAPVQSHLSENPGEVKWVAELFPDQSDYHQVYNHYGLFGQTPTLMAHCIYLTQEAIECIKSNQVVTVHCPDSNINLASGIMPVRKLLNAAVQVGLGSDVGAGHSLSMTQAMVKAIQLSKINYVFDHQCDPLTLSEVFYMATKGGGKFFGRVGSFEKGYSFDALVIEDNTEMAQKASPVERLQRYIYALDASNIVARYIAGQEIQSRI